MKNAEMTKSHWGTDLSRDFFHWWTVRLVRAGIYSAYLQCTEDYVRDVLDEPDYARAVRQTSRSETPLGVDTGVEITDEYGSVVGRQIFLVKINPETGETLDHSDGCWVGDVMNDGTIADRNDTFSREQVGLIIEQLQDQEIFGLAIELY